MEWSAAVLTTAVGDDEGKGGPSMEISTIAIEIGKNPFADHNPRIKHGASVLH
jgi:hypothetical protein